MLYIFYLFSMGWKYRRDFHVNVIGLLICYLFHLSVSHMRPLAYVTFFVCADLFVNFTLFPVLCMKATCRVYCSVSYKLFICFLWVGSKEEIFM